MTGSINRIWPLTDVGKQVTTNFRQNLPRMSGKFGGAGGFILVASSEETSMTYLSIPDNADIRPRPSALLDALIAEAIANVAQADADVVAAMAALGTIEPHPHAHGYTAGKDCRYAGFRTDDLEPLAGLLGRPWRRMLSALEDLQAIDDLDYLLKAVPIFIDIAGTAVIEEGRKRLDNLRELVTDLQSPFLAIGMVWHGFGFHHRDRQAWVGLFAYRNGLSQLVGTVSGITEDMSLGAALSATVQTYHVMLTTLGIAELDARAAARDAERQASWAAVSPAYRERGSWRGWAPTKRQGQLMRRIETARGLPMTALPRRGDASDWIRDAGGNPRFHFASGE